MKVRHFFLIPLALLFGVFLPLPALAQRGVLERVIRRAAKVPNDIPIHHLDEAVSSQQLHRRIVDEGLQRLGTRVDAPRPRRQLLLDLVQKVTGGVDSTIERALTTMDDTALEGISALALGANALQKGVGDVAARGRYLREGGGDLLLALGRFDDLAVLPKGGRKVRRMIFDPHGKPILRNGKPFFEETVIRSPDVVRFRAALEADKLLPYNGRMLTLADFGRFFSNGGRRAKHFWDKYVRPHWRYWLGSAALTAILLAPDEYLDSAGELTKEGIKKLARCGGTILVGVLEGVSEGGQDVVKRGTKTFLKGFFSSGWGIVSLLIIVLGAVVSFRRSRQSLFGLLAFLYCRLRSVWNQKRVHPSEQPKGD